MIELIEYIKKLYKTHKKMFRLFLCNTIIFGIFVFIFYLDIQRVKTSSSGIFIPQLILFYPICFIYSIFHGIFATKSLNRIIHPNLILFLFIVINEILCINIVSHFEANYFYYPEKQIVLNLLIFIIPSLICSFISKLISNRKNK